jgi:predicted RND superfamily exporter protein
MEDKTLNIKVQRNVLIIVILLLVIIGYIGWTRIQNLDTRLSMSEQNTKALTDSVRVGKTKNGQLESSINVLITEKGDLDKLSKNLADELKKEKGKVSELMSILAHIKLRDTIYIENKLIQYSNGVYGLKWDYDTTFNAKNSRSIAGESRFKQDTIKTIVNGVEKVEYKITPLNTSLFKDDIKFNLITGLREKDGNIEIFARSDYPNLTISDLEGAIIDPKNHPVMKKFTKNKKWGVGPYIGVGVGSDLKFNLQVGLGITFSIFKF